MINRMTVRAGLAAALAVVVLGAAACAADVQPGGGSGRGPGSSSSSAASGAAGAFGTANAGGTPSTAESGSVDATAVDATATDSATAGDSATAVDSATAAGGSRTAPSNYEPRPTGASTASDPEMTPSGGAATPIPAGLDGYRFRADRATGRTLGSGTSLSIGFANGTVSLNAGCNSGRGAPVFAGATLVVRQMSATEMACGERGGNGIMNQENWYMDWLTKGVGWKLDGTDLVLSGHGVTVTFARLGPADRLDTAAASSSTSATNTAPSTTAPGGSPDEPTAAAPGTLVRPRPPSSITTMSPKTQRPGDSIPIQPTG